MKAPWKAGGMTNKHRRKNRQSDPGQREDRGLNTQGRQGQLNTGVTHEGRGRQSPTGSEDRNNTQGTDYKIKQETETECNHENSNKQQRSTKQKILLQLT